MDRLTSTFLFFLFCGHIGLTSCSKQAAVTNQPFDHRPLWEQAKGAVEKAETASGKAEAARWATEGITIAKQCIAKTPEEPACYYYKAIATGLYYDAHVVGYQTGLKEMVNDLESAIKLDPVYDYGGAYRILSQIYAQVPESGPASAITRDLDRAEHYLIAAIDAAPDYPPNYLELSEVRLAQANPEKASEALVRADHLIPFWRSQKEYAEWVKRTAELKEKLVNH